MACEEAICRSQSDNVRLQASRTFNLKQIAESGQCFRLTELKDGSFIAVTGMSMVKITPDQDGGYVFHCSFDEFLDVWVPYFDLATDYEFYQDLMAGDSFLQSAIAEGGGIRILRQDLWETVVTFVISQCNNIPRIRSTVEVLCQNFGTPLGEVDGKVIYSFPTAEQMSGKDLSCAHLGYRERYVKELCNWRPYFWTRLANQDDITAQQILLNLDGVGNKVASCIMLYGLHRMNSYPRDVWVNRLIDDIYGGSFDPSLYPGCAGYVQQLQFFYYRKIAKEAKKCDC